MRHAVFALVLLCAAAGSAAIEISGEVVSDPLTIQRPRTSGVPAVSMAKDRVGVAIAWSMASAAGVEHVYVARLDTGGHVAGAVREIAATDPLLDAVGPSIAANPSGIGFTLAWIESSHLVYCVLDAALVPSEAKSLGPADGAAGAHRAKLEQRLDRLRRSGVGDRGEWRHVPVCRRRHQRHDRGHAASAARRRAYVNSD